MGDLQQQINIGKDCAKKLQQVGINTFEELKTVGSEQAFLRIKAVDPGACLSMLSALEGAILGIRWHNLPPGRKEELRQFFKEAQKHSALKK
jgi:DNA transformation protein and related proteins